MLGYRRALVGLALVVATAACQWPRDAEGTLDRVRGGTEQLAGELDAEVEWVEGSESELMEALHVRALDLVVAGLDSAAPWQDEASLTRHYLTTRTVVAVPSDDPATSVDALAGREVAVEAGTAEAERVRTYDVRPHPVEDVARADGPVVVDDWRLDDLGLRSLDAEVSRSEHVVAVPLGENGWQTTVERFLLTRSRAELDRLLDEEQP